MKLRTRAMMCIPGLVLSLCAVSPALALETGGAVVATTALKTTTTWSGQKLAWPQGEAEATILKVDIAPGGETGWHLHPGPSFGIVVKGTLEVTLKDGRVKRLEEGEMLAEVVATLHNGRNVGKGPLQLVVFYPGSVGTPLSEKPASP